MHLLPISETATNSATNFLSAYCLYSTRHLDFVLGNHINPMYVQERNGLFFTDLNRTISDALVNESRLDMQGITEAISRYYYANGESFEGISVVPEYQARFEQLAAEAINYYSDGD